MSMEDSQTETQDLGAVLEGVFIPPSVDKDTILKAESYTYHSEIPASVATDKEGACILGVDEAGPMVYAISYCLKSDAGILKDHKFDDSKKLTPEVRSNLMRNLSTNGTALFSKVGWATTLLSPRDISAGMLRATSAGSYNLNAQAHDTTIKLIREIIAKGVNIQEIYVDTVGPPTTYQTKLQRLFPTATVTVTKKADSLFPIVSAASVCAKVTRDAALEECLEPEKEEDEKRRLPLGSGYPGDEKTKTWLKGNMDPVFGWNANVTRFSWATAKDMIEGKGAKVEVVWPEEVDDGEQLITGFFAAGDSGLGNWYGKSAAMDF
ncbi:hypothetical protein RUND412_008973 [Rhizina undulata]